MQKFSDLVIYFYMIFQYFLLLILANYSNKDLILTTDFVILFLDKSEFLIILISILII